MATISDHILENTSIIMVQNFTTPMDMSYHSHDSDLIGQYQSTTDALLKYAGTIIIILGTVFHILALVTLCCSPAMRRQSSTVYMIAMSLTGLVTLYSGLLRWIIIGYSQWSIDIRDHSDAGCRIQMTITYMSLQYFAWLQATVAVDRLIAVRKPHRYMNTCSWKIGSGVVLGQLLLAISLCVMILVMSGHDDMGNCQMPFAKIWGYIDLASYSLVPALILIICNCLVAAFLTHHDIKFSSKSRDEKAFSVTVMLLALNIFFIVTTLPISVIFFMDYGEYGTAKYFKLELIYTVFSLFQYIGTSCSFLVYCLTGTKFREEFRKLLCNKSVQRCSHALREPLTSCPPRSDGKTTGTDV